MLCLLWRCLMDASLHQAGLNVFFDSDMNCLHRTWCSLADLVCMLSEKTCEESGSGCQLLLSLGMLEMQVFRSQQHRTIDMRFTDTLWLGGHWLLCSSARDHCDLGLL